jgi:hypothetical protein
MWALLSSNRILTLALTVSLPAIAELVQKWNLVKPKPWNFGPCSGSHVFLYFCGPQLFVPGRYGEMPMLSNSASSCLVLCSQTALPSILGFQSPVTLKEKVTRRDIFQACKKSTGVCDQKSRSRNWLAQGEGAAARAAAWILSAGLVSSLRGTFRGAILLVGPDQQRGSLGNVGNGPQGSALPLSMISAVLPLLTSLPVHGHLGSAWNPLSLCWLWNLNSDPFCVDFTI